LLGLQRQIRRESAGQRVRLVLGLAGLSRAGHVEAKVRARDQLAEVPLRLGELE
jgi:hypothetical protein